MNRNDGLLITVLALTLIAIAAYGSDLAYRYAQRAFAAPAAQPFDVLGNAQELRSGDTAAACTARGGVIEWVNDQYVVCHAGNFLGKTSSP